MTVLLFTWFCYTNENPGIVFVAMNYSVHAIMCVRSPRLGFRLGWAGVGLILI